MNMDNTEMGPPSELQSGDGNDSVYEEYGNVYEEYGAVDIEQLNVDVRETSDENSNERGEEEYEAYDGDYEPYRHIETQSTDPKITKKKMLIIFLVLGIAGLVIGLSVHFTKPAIPSILSNTTVSSTFSNITTTTAASTTTPGVIFNTPGIYLYFSLIIVLRDILCAKLSFKPSF